MTNTTIEPSACYYITASTLAKISPLATEAIECFFNADLNVSFGDANRTLIDIPHFMDMLQDAMDADDLFYDEDGNVHKGYEEIKNALDEYSDSVYIDLEN